MTIDGRRIRVLMTADAVGGVWQYCVDLLRSLAESDIEILLATMGPLPSEQQKRQICCIRHVTLVESNHCLEWMPGGSQCIEESGQWLMSLQEQFQPDLVHLNGYCHASLPWGCPVVVVAHSCVFSWWSAVHGCEPPLEEGDWANYQAAVTAGLSNATAIVAPSYNMSVNLQRHYAIDRKATVIYNSSRVCAERNQSKWPTCLAAGRVWDSAKNLATLDDIALNVDWPIRVAGDNKGPLKAGKQLRHVDLLGVMTHEELLRTMRRSSIYLHPAFYEPFGLTVLEAARSGCCLVLADIPSMRELWEGHALFVDARDPEQWTFELNGLIKDHARRERLGRSAQKHSGRYSVDRFANAYLRVYQNLVERSLDRMVDGAAA